MAGREKKPGQDQGDGVDPAQQDQQNFGNIEPEEPGGEGFGNIEPDDR